MNVHWLVENISVGSIHFPFRVDVMNKMSIFKPDIKSKALNSYKSKNVEVNIYSDGNVVLSSEFKKNKKSNNSSFNLLPDQIPKKWEKVFPEDIFFHNHPYFEISYIISGECIYIANNRVIELQGNEFIMINGDVPHAWLSSAEKPAKVMVFLFFPITMHISSSEKSNIDYLEMLFGPDVFFLNFTNNNTLTPVFSKILLEISREFEKKEIGFENIIHSKLIEMFTLMIRNNPVSYTKPEEYTKSKSLQNALNYINENFCENIHLNDVAKVAFMNPSYFSSYFKKTMGLSYSRYINHLRISKVITLLHSDKNIIDIAYQCGFTSMSGFYKAFKSIQHVTPSEYTKKREKDL